MKDLLQEWAELEPSRCKFEAWADNYGHWVQQDIITVWVGPRASGGYKVEIIQHAVQQAIEARGWVWSLVMQHTGSKYLASARGRLGRSDDSPAHALLSAYLQAIKAQVAA